ncbi:SubName: Full=Uncharacterized protein {ECO:0000313/EMBL:CCA75936.1} [Serendipita indica DSM 11827]|uniref:Histone chaperone domain-containing protein n=1 Tax=Serendipita indica (strain DSM 11827) TaxID=1109443 RepID=G4TX93_SERID|nr:SubName: Full=Uncharacterized protein {ECO:0000313/EMBL:CCA75936.1} [Serendipita indica DSM 11827]CAG7852978.1 SubName: Full=Uncharacterized protein {ECO:0000313/EMBL:CCA75936.1} [Serendipita indica DSM 11827]CCA75936.1 hypothetical protein PIIN_09932 [Serendipita indica DSM 11827]
MSDTEMQMDTTEGHREVEHEESIEQSMDQSEHEGDETHDESEDSEDEEALVEMDPAKILPTRIRPNMPKVDYTSPEAIARAGIAGQDEPDPQDAEYIPTEEAVPEDEDHSMQQ